MDRVFRLFAAWLTLPSLAFAETLPLERAIPLALSANPDLWVVAAEIGSIHRLLVPVDFSEASASALRVAAFIADKRQAAVTVLHPKCWSRRRTSHAGRLKRWNVVAAPTDSPSTGIDHVAEFIRVCGRPVLFVPEPTSVSA